MANKNIQREDLNPLEEANIYKTLIDEQGYTQETLAEKIGKSRSYVANLVRLLKLPDKFKKLINEMNALSNLFLIEIQ